MSGIFELYISGCAKIGHSHQPEQEDSIWREAWSPSMVEERRTRHGATQWHLEPSPETP